jgi:hypothetical protein
MHTRGMPFFQPWWAMPALQLAQIRAPKCDFIFARALRELEFTYIPF